MSGMKAQTRKWAGKFLAAWSLTLAAAPVASLAAPGVSLSDILAPVQASALATPSERSETRRDGETRQKKESHRVLRRSEILDRLVERLRKQHRGLGGLQIEGKDAREWPYLKIKDSAGWKLVCETAFSPEPDGRWLPRLTILVNGKLRESFRPELEVSLFREVWMTRDRLARGSRPLESLLEPVVRNLYEGRYRPIPVTEDLTGFELERSVAAGRLLEWDDLRERPLVRRGETVEVVVSKGALNIAMRAKCLEDGTRGQVVTLRNPDTRHEFTGTVVGRNRIQFEP